MVRKTERLILSMKMDTFLPPFWSRQRLTNLAVRLHWYSQVTERGEEIHQQKGSSGITKKKRKKKKKKEKQSFTLPHISNTLKNYIILSEEAWLNV